MTGLRPSPLEIAAGRMFGEHEGAQGIGKADDGTLSPLAALEAAILPALARPPCLVSFSGGRDSSSVLAAATRAAAREGLDPPVPVTLRLRDAPMSDEAEWQELVVRDLGPLPAEHVHSDPDAGGGPRRHPAQRLRRR